MYSHTHECMNICINILYYKLLLEWNFIQLIKIKDCDEILYNLTCI